MNSARYWANVADEAVGIGMANLNGSKLGAMQVPVPPRPAQDAICDYLDTLSARTSATRRHLASATTAIDRFRQSVLAAACRGDLTATWRSKRGPGSTGSALLANIIEERSQRRDAGDHPRTGTLTGVPTEGLFAVPETWTWAIWNDLADWITYGFTRPMPHVDEGVPIVTAKSIRDGQISFTDAARTTSAAFANLSEKDIPRPGEILLTKDGSIGRAAIVPIGTQFCINQSVAVIRFGGTSADARYLKLAIEAPFTQGLIAEAAKGSAIQHIAITAFGRLKVPVPPLEEQLEIIRIVGALMDQAASIEQRLELAETHLQRASRGVLVGAFGGPA